MPFMSYSFKETGNRRINEISEGLNNIVGFEGLALLEETVNRVIDASIEIAKVYPPEFPASGYQRGWGARNKKTKKSWGAKKSQDLGDSWGKSVVSGNNVVVGFMFNTAKYASFVMGKGTQAAIHVGVWNTAEDIVDAVLGLRTGAGNVSVNRIGADQMKHLETGLNALIAKYTG